MDQALLKRIIEAHGGMARWKQVESIQIDIDIFGPILMTKFKSPWLSNITANIFTDKPYVSLHNFPEQGMTGIFDGYDVYIYNQNDRIDCERNFRVYPELKTKPRLRWDHLDMVYFLGYALWNYLCTPFMLDDEHFECIQGADWEDNDGHIFSTLNVRYPDNVPSHCSHQVFYFNEKGLLARNDYTANIFSPIAIGAHYCTQHKTFDGLVFPTHRSVFPRLWNGKPLRPLKVMDGHIKNLAIQWKSALVG